VIEKPGSDNFRNRLAYSSPAPRVRIVQLGCTGSIEKETRDFQKHLSRMKGQGCVDHRCRLRCSAAFCSSLRLGEGAVQAEEVGVHGKQRGRGAGEVRVHFMK
jgi:hypothetical protein